MPGTPTNALIGYGSTLEVETFAGSGVYQMLAEIKTVAPPNAQVADVDATHMQSPDKIKEYISGMIELGEIPFDMNWVPGSDTDKFIIAWKKDGSRRSTRVTYGLSGIFDVFLSYVKGYSGAVPIDNVMTAQLTVKVAGATADRP